MPDEMEDKTMESMIDFIDFLYALVFGLIVAEMYPDVIMAATMPVWEKASSLLLVIAAFYFLAWDWLHSRLLTLKNPYKRYFRFFLEILVAACAYGVAFAALQKSIYVLHFVALILLIGCWWARVTLKEYPKSEDKKELDFIQQYQFRLAVVVEAGFMIRYFVSNEKVSMGETVVILVMGWICVFAYEWVHERPEGLLGGPGVPLLGREKMNKLRQKVNKWKGD